MGLASTTKTPDGFKSNNGLLVRRLHSFANFDEQLKALPNL
jgi:hypothetical protein